MSTKNRLSLDTSPVGLQRLYYQMVLTAVGSVLALQVLTRLVLGGTQVVTPQRVALYGTILLLSWFGHELAKDSDFSAREPKGVLLGILGLLLVILCIETGGLASAYYVLLLTTAVFGALLMGAYKAFLLTSFVAAAYCLGTWLYPSAGGLLDGGIRQLVEALKTGRRANAEEVSALVIHSGFLYVCTWMAMRLAGGFREKVVRLETTATRDPLTGLPNRRGFMEKLRLEAERAREWDWPIAILVMDLDHFKKVNDRFGHPVGDEVLTAAASLMREAAGPLDHVARVGGEEFAVAAVGADRRQGADVADRIVRSFRRKDWESVHNGLTVTCSVGVAVIHPTRDGEALHDLSTIIDTADQALLQVKQRGRNGYLVSGDATASAPSTAHLPKTSASGGREPQPANATLPRADGP